MGDGCSLDYVVFFWEHLQNSIQDLMGGVTLRQSAEGKDPPKNDSTTIKTQLHLESQHKWQKEHPKNIKLRRSRRLHH